MLDFPTLKTALILSYVIQSWKLPIPVWRKESIVDFQMKLSKSQ